MSKFAEVDIISKMGTEMSRSLQQLGIPHIKVESSN